MIAALAYLLVLFLINSSSSLAFPFGLDYGEGIVWQQALLIFTRKAYGPIDSFPSIVFHYTPLYQTLVFSMTTLTGWDMLFTGRAISICSTLLIIIMVGIIVIRTAPISMPIGYQFLVGAASGLVTLSAFPIYFWAQLMRVDMLALLFSLLGFWLGLKAFQKPAWIYLAALFFVAAVFTKQNAITAPMALFSLMLWLKPRLALTGLSTCFISGLVILSALSYLTEGRFVKHILLYNINTIDFGRIHQLIKIIAIHGVLVTVVILALIIGIINIASILREFRGKDRRNAITSNQYATTTSAILTYFIVATPMLLLYAKVGSGYNYTIEWFITCSMLIGTVLFDSATILTGQENRNGKTANIVNNIKGLAIPILIAIHIFEFDFALVSFKNFKENSIHVNELEKISNIVRDSDKPIISDDMVMLLRSGKSVEWEPAIFAQLEKAGVWKALPFETRIQRGEFSMFITKGQRGDVIFDERYTNTVADSMDAAYPIKKTIAGLTLHLPSTSVVLNK
jgi:hypothetical protein